MITKIAVVGLGKIARDQHLRVIDLNPNYELVAVVSSSSSFGDVPTFKSITELAHSGVHVDAVVLCMPPLFRFKIAKESLDAGYDILLERPPAATVGEVEALVKYARDKGRIIFTAWHSRHNTSVIELKKMLCASKVKSLKVVWKEDVRFWHPNQEWIWEPGGFGVFDPGINAFSLLTQIIPSTLLIKEAKVFKPSNKFTPVSAFLRFAPVDDMDVDWTAEFDWLKLGEPSWDIHIKTDGDQDILLSNGGTHLYVDGKLIHAGSSSDEYEDIYHHFSILLKSRCSDADTSPLRLVSDSFMIAALENTVPFF